MNFAKFIKLVFIFTIVGLIIIGLGIFAVRAFNGNFDILKQLSNLNPFAKKDRVNALILGTDESGNRTDFIMFASYNQGNSKVNMISIPRDTKVKSSKGRKINSLYKKGDPSKILNEVEDILGVPIKYYFVVNLKGFRNAVDEVGGIPMDVPTNMKYVDPYQDLVINIPKGYQVLDGRKAEGFVRYRSGYATADLGRIEAQHAFISAAIDQFLKPQNLPKLPKIISIVFENVNTNMKMSQALTYLDDAVKIKKENITMERLPGEPKYIGGASYYINNENETSKMVERMFYNEENVTDQSVIQRNSIFKVEVYNATGIPGLGSKVADQLKASGFNVIKVGNYTSNTDTTKIYERNKSAEGSYVKNVIRFGEIIYKESSEDIDYTVVVGEDIGS